jgi:hypothetical protein
MQYGCRACLMSHPAVWTRTTSHHIGCRSATKQPPFIYACAQQGQRQATFQGAEWMVLQHQALKWVKSHAGMLAGSGRCGNDMRRTPRPLTRPARRCACRKWTYVRPESICWQDQMVATRGITRRTALATPLHALPPLPRLLATQCDFDSTRTASDPGYPDPRYWHSGSLRQMRSEREPVICGCQASGQHSKAAHQAKRRVSKKVALRCLSLTWGADSGALATRP